MLETPWFGFFLFQELYTLLQGWNLVPDGNLIPLPGDLIMVGRARVSEKMYRPMNEAPGSKFVKDGVGLCPHFEQILFLGSNLLGISEEDFREAAAFCGAYVAQEDLTHLCRLGRVALLDGDAATDEQKIVERFLPVRACEVVWATIKWLSNRSGRAKEHIEAIGPHPIGELADGRPFDYQVVADFLQDHRIVTIASRIEKGITELLRTLDAAGQHPFKDYGEAREAFYQMHLLDRLGKEAVGVSGEPVCAQAPELLDPRCERNPFFLLASGRRIG